MREFLNKISTSTPLKILVCVVIALPIWLFMFFSAQKAENTEVPIEVNTIIDYTDEEKQELKEIQENTQKEQEDNSEDKNKVSPSIKENDKLEEGHLFENSGGIAIHSFVINKVTDISTDTIATLFNENVFPKIREEDPTGIFSNTNVSIEEIKKVEDGYVSAGGKHFKDAVLYNVFVKCGDIDVTFNLVNDNKNDQTFIHTEFFKDETDGKLYDSVLDFFENFK